MIPDGTPSRPTEEFTAPTIRFVGEQDGPPERDLKSHIAELLTNELEVDRAYLARVQYDDAENWNVALCLAATNPDISRINERIGRLFAGIFANDMHLDILYLSDAQEEEITKVCTSFYKAC
jgi:hypothetical protein